MSLNHHIALFLPFSSARYYNSDLSIWLSVDPMVDKYPNLSPYTYCANNPIALKDPNGDSIAVLLANSLPVLGHMAILIQAHGGENDGKWALWSKNGENKSSSNSVTNDDDLGTQYWNSPQEFIKNNNEQYVEAYILPTNTEQDKKITAGFKKSESKNYNFFYTNCAVAVQEGLKNAGLDDGRLSAGQKNSFGNFTYLHTKQIIHRVSSS